MGLLLALFAAAGSGLEPATLVFPSGAELRGVLLSDASGLLRLEADGGLVEFPREAVSAVRSEPNDYATFLIRKEKTVSAADWWALSLWARERGLPGSARLAAERVLALEPGHSAAKAALAPSPERRIEDPYARPRPARETEEMRAARLVAAEIRRLGALRAPPVNQGITRVVFFGRRFLPPEEERGPQTGPGPWRPEPFRSAHPVLGIPPSEPVGSRFP